MTGHTTRAASARAAGRFLAGVRDAAAVDEHEGGIAAKPAHVERGANRLRARGAAVHEVVIEAHRAAQLRDGQADVREPGHAAALELDLDAVEPLAEAVQLAQRQVAVTMWPSVSWMRKIVPGGTFHSPSINAPLVEILRIVPSYSLP